MAVLANGQILVTGSMNNIDGDKDLVLARYNSNGTLDTTFGSGGAGYTLVDVSSSSQDTAYAMAVQSDGKIVIAGGTVEGGKIDVARFNAGGTVDTSFNATGAVPGVQTINIAGSDQANAVVIDPTTGAITLAGKSGSDTALARLTSTGALDATFGTGGTETLDLGGTDFAAALTLLANGKYLVASTANNDFEIARLNSTGGLDPSFGTAGRTEADLGGADVVGGMAVAADGKIVLVGQTPGGAGNPQDFAAVRYNANGSVDTSFGTGGIAKVDFGNTTDGAVGVVIQPDLKVVIAGKTVPGVGATTDFALARLQGNTAPVIATTPASLDTIVEDDFTNTGTLVSTLVSRLNITDANGDTPLGIAVTGLNNSHGAWQYSIDGGSNWSPIGAVTTTGALLLAGNANDRIRFIPDAHFNTTEVGDPNYSATLPSVTVVAWDGVTGISGATADTTVADNTNSFGNSGTLNIAVTGVNNAPTVFVPGAQAVDEDNALALTGITVADLDAGTGDLTVTLGVLHGTLAVNTAGLTSFSGNSSGSVTLTGSQSALNTALSTLSYQGVQDYNGPDTLSVNVNDNGHNGTGGAQSASNSVAITVNPVNDAPVLSGANDFTTITEDQIASGGDLVSALIAGHITDVDSGAVQGIAVTGLNNGNGTWQYSTDGGANWLNVGTVIGEGTIRSFKH